MRIVIDARIYGLEHAGPGRYVKNLVDHLAVLDKKNQYIILLRKKYFDELNLPKNFEKYLAEYNHYSFKEQFMLLPALYKLKPDLIHFPFFNVPILYFGKFIVTIHDLTMHYFKGGEATTRGWVQSKIWRIGYHIAFAKAVYGSKKIIVPSKYVESDLVKYYKIKKRKVEVTYEGVDDAIKVTKKSASVLKKYNINNQYFIYSGSAYPHKNLKTAIEAIALLNKKRKQKVLLVLTSSRTIFTERVLAWAKEMGVEKYIKHVGFVPDDDLANLYTNSLAYVYPTLSEGFGLPGLEAMSAKALVIASDIKVLKEVYGDNAIYFDPRDVKSLTEVMNKVIKMPSFKKEERIENSLVFIKKYSWKKMTKETLAVYINFTTD